MLIFFFFFDDEFYLDICGYLSAYEVTVVTSRSISFTHGNDVHFPHPIQNYKECSEIKDLTTYK